MPTTIEIDMLNETSLHVPDSGYFATEAAQD
jgi:hypothetical protein